MAARALGQIRLIAIALMLVGGAGYRPSAGSLVSRGQALPLAGAAAAVLLLVAVLTGPAGRARAGRRTALAVFSVAADTAVVLGVVWVAGLPPHSFALVLFMLPLLEAALWFGLPGLGGVWTLTSVALGGLIVSFPAQVSKDALGALIVAMPTLLLATIPVAQLAEHLVAQVGGLLRARQSADDRARLLGDLSAITAEIFPLDVDAVLAQLVTGTVRLGAAGAVVGAPAAGRVLAAAGDEHAVAAVPPTEPETDGETVQRSVLLTRELAVPGAPPYRFTAAMTATRDELARRTEAIDLLVAQAGVALATAVLVEQLEQLKQTYQDQASHDQLTGLLNRRGLVLEADGVTARLGVLFCDLDGFKGVNDTLGHAAGDELLEKVARRLEQNVRADSVLGRVGGDEFVIVLPDPTDDDLVAVSRRIEVALGRPFLLGAGMARIGVSIGIAHAGAGQRDLDTLLDEADHLMYQTKRSRKAARAGRGELTGTTA